MPRVRLTLSFGLPDPDRLSTALAWSLLAHVGLGVGVLVYQALPSQNPLHNDAFFVRLAAPSGPKGGGPGRSPEVKAEAAPSAPPGASKPTPPRKEAVAAAPAPPAPAKASRVPDHPPDKAKAHTPAPVHEAAAAAPAGTTEAPQHGVPVPTEPSTASQAGAGAGAAGAGGGVVGPGAGAGGVGGTEFGEGDFQYGWYQSAIETKLRSMWRPPVAEGAEVQTATVSFTITRTGAVKDITISTASGNSALDRSVLSAVYSANPLPALPPGWTGDSVHVSMEFRLNPGE